MWMRNYVAISVVTLFGLAACEAPPADSQNAEAPAPSSQDMPAPALIFPALNVLDLAATEAFYIDMLGMKVALRLGGEGAASQEVSLNFSGDVYAPEPSLLLHYKEGRTEPYVFDAFSRIAFRVKDVGATVERIRAAGYKVLSEPSVIKGTSIKLAFVEDPNGASVELIEGMASAQELTGNP